MLTIGVEWVKGQGHTSEGARATDVASSQIPRRPPSRTSRSRLRNAQNICATTNWCGLHSVYTNHQDREKSNDNNFDIEKKRYV